MNTEHATLSRHTLRSFVLSRLHDGKQAARVSSEGLTIEESAAKRVSGPSVRNPAQSPVQTVERPGPAGEKQNRKKFRVNNISRR